MLASKPLYKQDTWLIKDKMREFQMFQDTFRLYMIRNYYKDQILYQFP